MYVLYLLVDTAPAHTHGPCCRTVADVVVCAVAARLLLRCGGSVGSYRDPALPPAQHPILVAHFLRLCTCAFLLLKSTGITAHTRTHKRVVRGRHKRKSLMCDCCCPVAASFVESSRDGVIRHHAAAASSQQQRKKKQGVRGPFPLSCLALLL